MALETRFHAFAQDQLQASVQGVNQVDGGGAEVAGPTCLVSLHDGQPIADVGVVVRNGGFATLPGLDRCRTHHDQGQSRRHTDGFLRGRHAHVHPPLRLAEFSSRRGAHPIHHGEDAALPGQRRQPFHVGQDAGGGVHLGDGHQLRTHVLQHLGYCLAGRQVPDLGIHGGDFSAVAAADGREALAEKPGVHHHDPVAGFDEVRRGHVHGQRAGPGQHERLAVFGQKYVAQLLQGGPEDVHKLRRDVAHRRAPHGAQHGRIELDGTGDHQKFAFVHENLLVSVNSNQ